MSALRSAEQTLARAFRRARLAVDRKAFARALVMEEARRRGSRFVKVTRTGEVYFHGQIGEREAHRFYRVAESVEEFAAEIAGHLKTRAA